MRVTNRGSGVGEHKSRRPYDQLDVVFRNRDGNYQTEIRIEADDTRESEFHESIGDAGKDIPNVAVALTPIPSALSAEIRGGGSRPEPCDKRYRPGTEWEAEYTRRRCVSAQTMRCSTLAR